jgi:hypothetical protein
VVSYCFRSYHRAHHFISTLFKPDLQRMTDPALNAAHAYKWKSWSPTHFCSIQILIIWHPGMLRICNNIAEWQWKAYNSEDKSCERLIGEAAIIVLFSKQDDMRQRLFKAMVLFELVLEYGFVGDSSEAASETESYSIHVECLLLSICFAT